MGVYLSSPVTEKESRDGQCERFNYGASSMQGWRISQEDAHNCIPLFNEQTKTSFFAVYDGHGGSEVAKYCEKHFPEFVKSLMEKQDGTEDLVSLIKNAFLAFDATLTDDNVIKELKELAGNDDDEEDEDDDPVGCTETELLTKEANMPLDQLLAQYKSTAPEDIKNFHEKDTLSPTISSKCESSDIGTSRQDAENGSSSSASTSLLSSSPCKQNSSSQLCSDEDVNKSSRTDQSQTLDAMKAETDISDNHTRSDNNSIDKTTTAHNNLSFTTTDDSSSTSSPSTTTHEAAANHSTSHLASGNGQTEVCNRPLSCDSPQLGESSSGSVSSPNLNDEPSGSGTNSSAGVRTSKAMATVDLAMMDGDTDTSDDDDDEEDIWEDTSDEEDDEDEPDEDVPMMNTSDEEPGSDSGCTACVVLIQDKKLIVANAGDSRCVLSRAGKAVELSFDHKPEDDSEKDRIENAGGKVTADGRVNGGLNLSRAIGDHVYKRNTDLPAEEQMITALPDVETAELCDEDQFIVIACDGIWNYMSSQEVVEFVLEKLQDPEKRQKPSVICEELFDHCLAPNTSGDGTGCDNMTCIIIVLDTFINSRTQPPIHEAAHTIEVDNKSAENSSEQQLTNMNEVVGSLKRCADNIEVREQKRLKLNDVA